MNLNSSYQSIKNVEELVVILALKASLAKKEAILRKKIKNSNEAVKHRIPTIRLRLMEKALDIFIKCAVFQMTRKTPIINIRQISPPVDKNF